MALPLVLHVTSAPLGDPGDLLQWTAPRHPAVFLRGGDGLVGFGEATSFRDTTGDWAQHIGPWWRSLCNAAIVDDSVGLPGSGLVAFGSFTFDRASREPSILSVPSVVVGRRDGVSWVTRITIGDTAGLEPQREPFGTDFRADLAPGSQTPDSYEDAVAAAVERIAAGEASKVVLARDLVGTGTTMADLRTVLARLVGAYPDTYAFAVDGLIGASPETLVRVRDGRATARVLAGSAARTSDAADILSSAKDRAEHEFARASLVAALAPHVDTVEAGETFALPLPNLWHLATDVSGALTDDSTSLDLVAALHPTAAVAGSPTDVALALIRELEPFDRGRYAGPVGWVGAAGDGEWAIALRCALIDEHDHVTAYAGAGIVGASDPARELAETELKFRPIVDALRP